MPWLFLNKIFAVIYFFLIMKYLSTAVEMMAPVIEKEKKNHSFMQFQIKCLRIECCQKSKNMLKRSKYHHCTISFQVYYLCTLHLSLSLGKKCRRALNWFFKVDWWCVFVLCQTEHSWRPGYWTNPLPLMKFPIHCVKQAQINVPFDGKAIRCDNLPAIATVMPLWPANF